MSAIARLVHVAAVLVCISVPAAAHTYVVLQAPFPNTQGTFARGVNNAGAVVGTYVELNGRQHGFLYRHGRYVSIDVPHSRHTQATGINDLGVIVGFYEDVHGTHAFRYDGLFARLDVPFAKAIATFATGINNHGQIVGYYNDGIRSSGYLYDRGRFVSIGVPNSSTTTLFGINDKGEIVGTALDDRFQSFIYSDGVFTPFDVPFANAFDFGALGINDRGDVVGYFQTGTPQANTGLHGFLAANGMYDQIDVPGGINPMVWGINNCGVMVGDFVSTVGPQMFSGFIAVPTEQDRRAHYPPALDHD